MVRNAEKFKVTYRLRVDIELASHFNYQLGSGAYAQSLNVN
jgi:hypothetical protein